MPFRMKQFLNTLFKISVIFPPPNLIIIASGSDLTDKLSSEKRINLRYNLISMLSIIDNQPFGNVITAHQSYTRVFDVQL